MAEEKRVEDNGTLIWNPQKSVLSPLASVGSGCTIHAPVWIGPNVKIGDRCKVQAFAFIPEGVTIGNDCFIGPHVCFTNDRHPPSVDWEETHVEDGVSIGAGTVIMCGVTIGKGARIGARSLILNDVLAGATVTGIW